MKILRLLVKIVFAAAALFVIMLAGLCVISSDELEREYYRISSPKITGSSDIRIVAISDLHNKVFGYNNSELVSAIDMLDPDLILIAGDMVNKDSDDVETALSLCMELKEIAPLYYGFGNHEGSMVYNRGIRFDQILYANGIKLLINNAESIDIKGNTLDIGSVSTDEEGYDEYARSFVENFEKSDHFKIMITHLPKVYYTKMADVDIDLNIAGHFHGGQIRLPLVGGLFSPEFGFFPKYCSGEFELKNGKLIVSRGLGNHTAIPRINNSPEITVIDLSAG